MKPDELRSSYLSFFQEKGHTVWPSAPLVPENDPTLLFTGAGMNQFKEMFLGVGNLPFRRAATAQKCLRTGDLDNVGRTFYHHTFFEMLGNFSFGDYFKREAIAWAWEFATKVMRLPAGRLWISVYRDDEEALAIWRDEIGFPERKIWRLGPDSNFWPANAPQDGPDGPCGPCSEMFYDYGTPGADGDPEAARYCEFWNLVFTQFNRVGRDELLPLNQKNIDTGMGFERMLAILNGKRSNFETELFRPLIDATARLAGRRYAHDAADAPAFRRIADHVRAGVFLVADGVKPSNEGRGYVARRILRRAVRDGIGLGIDRPFLHELVPVLVDGMQSAYPETKAAEAAAAAFLRAEDERFRETYHAGIDLLERELRGLRGRVLPGETAFVLYDSHGFPYELCAEICAERGIAVDRAGFDREMERQRARSREESAMGGEVFVATAMTDLKRSARATEFLGYDRESAASEVVALLRGEEKIPRATPADGDVRLIAARTPFYAEAGGQVGDTGVIEGREARFHVAGTRRVEGYVLH
ncbi:MAG: alanine--tRNA ligase, partial [Planctomycetota bacterium]